MLVERGSPKFEIMPIVASTPVAYHRAAPLDYNTRRVEYLIFTKNSREFLGLSNSVFQETNPFVYLERLPLEIDSWKSLIYKSGNEITGNDVADIIGGLNELMHFNKFDQINDFISGIKVEEISITAMITILRTTFWVSSDLNEWVSFAMNCKLCIDKLGRNSGNLLRGLIP